jgi:threonine dehydratase
VAHEVARRLKATVVPPYDHKDIVLGQGTVMHEFLNQMGEEYAKKLDAVVIPVGGGGLLAGCAIACIGSGVKVFGAEPVIADDCARGLRQGFKERVLSSTDTIADGLRSEVGDLTFRIIQNHVDRVFTVTEEQISHSMKIIIERLKVVIEPSSAVAVAVVLFHEEFQGIAKETGIRNVGIVLEGGNIDTESYKKMMPWIQLFKSSL